MSKAYCKKVLYETIKTIMAHDEDLANRLNETNEVFVVFNDKKLFGENKIIEVSIKLKTKKDLGGLDIWTK